MRSRAMKEYYYPGLEALPKEPPRTRCDESGFRHAWKKVEPSGFVYLTNPPMYEPPMERCANCDLLRILHVEHRETWRYKTP